MINIMLINNIIDNIIIDIRIKIIIIISIIIINIIITIITIIIIETSLSLSFQKQEIMGPAGKIIGYYKILNYKVNKNIKLLKIYI